MPIQEQRKNPFQGKRIGNDGKNEEFIHRELRVENPNVLMLEEIF